VRGLATCYRESEAPHEVVRAIEALRAVHTEETQSEVFQAYAAAESRQLVYVDIRPTSYRFARLIGSRG
jgi:hypothetical protein